MPTGVGGGIRLPDLDARLERTLANRLAVDMERQAQLAVRLVALAIGLVLMSVFPLSAAGVYALTSFTVTRRR